MSETIPTDLNLDFAGLEAASTQLIQVILEAFEPVIRARIAGEIAMADWSGLIPGHEREAAIRIARGAS